MENKSIRVAVMIAALMVSLSSSLSLMAQVEEETVSRKLIELGNRTGFTYEQSVSSHFILRYSVGLSLNQALHPSHQSGLTYVPSKDQPHSDLGTAVETQKGKDSFHFVSQHYGISPYLSVAARWYPHPLEGNGGFYLQLAGEYIPNQWTLVKLGDYQPDMASVITFPLSMGYNFRLTDALDLRIAGRLIGGTYHNKPNKKWEGLFTTGLDFGVSYSF